MGNEDRQHLCTSSTHYKYARKRHGYIVLYNAKMQNVKSLLLVSNLVLFLKTRLQSRPFSYTDPNPILCCHTGAAHLCNLMVPSASGYKRLQTGTWWVLAQIIASSESCWEHQVWQLCQFSSSSHPGSFMLSIQAILWSRWKCLAYNTLQHHPELHCFQIEVMLSSWVN